ncbi:MAG TPA: AMP-binding protein, partial [Desulfobacteria bacterium]|nr:AMP-binding protein [Desulfobacteria bacterium]
MLIYDNLKKFSRSQPNKACLINGSRLITYREMDTMVDNYAHGLGNSVRKGDAILIKLNDPVEQLLYLLSISKLGAAAVLADPLTPEDLFIDLVKRANAAFCIDDSFSLQDSEADVLPEVN